MRAEIRVYPRHARSTDHGRAALRAFQVYHHAIARVLKGSLHRKSAVGCVHCGECGGFLSRMLLN
jgi:hypothetical protein